MRAIGYPKAGSLNNPEALIEFEAESPVLRDHDLLVEVRGVSMNPVDVKVRAGMAPEGGPRILGFDAAGIVKEVGTTVSHFKPGDEVFYAGDLTRPGTNAELHAVDERIVGKKPKSLGFAQAAAIPLTAITAWEILFDSLGLEEGGGRGETLLVIGGAGGVGSILIQLAKKLTDLNVVATASRPETVDWVKKMGADQVVNHRNPLDAEMTSSGIIPRYAAALTHTEKHFPALVNLIKPRGRIAVIDDPPTLDVLPLKLKAVSLCWEFMFARPMFGTEDLRVQGNLLNYVSELVDEGALIPTATEHFGPLTADNLRKAQAHQESGKAIGKTVLDGFLGE